MARIYVFGDEGGDLVFKHGQGSSRYIIVGTVTMTDCDGGTELVQLRRDLAWNGVILPDFHAHSDKQRVRDRVFDVLSKADFRIDTIILDKPKTQDDLRANPLRSYKEALYLHFKHVAPRIAKPLDGLLVVASSLQIKAKKKQIHWAVKDVVNEVLMGTPWGAVSGCTHFAARRPYVCGAFRPVAARLAS